METKRIINADAQLKAAGDGNGSCTGYAYTFGNFDRVGEKIVPGAFKNLDDFVQNGFVALGHDWDCPVGIPVSLIEDEAGGLLAFDWHGMDDAQECRQYVQERRAAGKSVAMSIGYRVNDCKSVPEGLLLTDLTLYEISIVTVPANPLALVTSVKGALPAGEPFTDHSESVLAAVREYAERVKALAGLRAKDGRVLSDANRQRISACKDALKNVHDELGGMLASSEPKHLPTPGEIVAVLVRARETQERLAALLS